MDFSSVRDGNLYSSKSRLTSKRPNRNNGGPAQSADIEMDDLSGKRPAEQGEKRLEFAEIKLETTPAPPPEPSLGSDEEHEVINFDDVTMPPKKKNPKQKLFEQPLLSQNDLKNHVRMVTYKDADVPIYGMLFWIEIIQVIWMTTTSIIGILVLTHSVVINNYVFLISGALLTLIFCTIQVMLFFAQVNKYPNLSKEAYYNDIGTCVAVTFVLEIFTWLTLGIWIRDFAICCDTANCQPNIADFNNFTRFYDSYLILTSLPLVTMLWVYPRAIAAHMNPTLIYNYSKKDE